MNKYRHLRSATTLVTLLLFLPSVSVARDDFSPDNPKTEYINLAGRVLAIESRGSDSSPNPSPLSAPANLTVAPNADAPTRQIDLRWEDKSTGEDGFIVERQTEGGAFAEIQRTGSNVVAILDSGLTTGTQYTYRVKAFNASGDSAYTPIVSITLQENRPKPAAPSALTGQIVLPNQLKLDWADNSNNETGFRIEFRREPFTQAALTSPIQRLSPATPASAAVAPNTIMVDGIVSIDPNTQSYTLTLNQGVKYYIRILALNVDIASDPSNTIEITIPADISSPNAPSDLTASGASPTSVVLSWRDNSANETEFLLFRQGPVDAAPIQYAFEAANATTYTDTNALAGTAYAYYVKARGNAGDSAASNIATVKTPGLTIAAPTDLAITEMSDTSITLAWTDRSSNEQYFAIERLDGVNADSVYREIARTSASTYSDSTARPLTSNYAYRVRAVNGTSASDYSNTTDTRPEAPKNVQARQTPGTQDVILTWTDADAKERTFMILRRSGQSGADQVLATVAGQTMSPSGTVTLSYNDANVPPGEYYYKVKAVDYANALRIGSSLVRVIVSQSNNPAPSLSSLAPSSVGVGSGTFTLTVTGTNFIGGANLQVNGAARTTTVSNATQLTAQLLGTDVATAGPQTITVVNPPPAGGRSNALTLTVTSPSLNAPSNLTATVVSSSQVILNWQDNSTNETGVRVYRQVGGAPFTFLTGLPGANLTSYVDPTVTQGNTYVYRVLAATSAADSEFSNEASVTIPGGAGAAPEAPANLTAVGDTLQIILNWTHSGTNVSGFKVERKLGRIEGYTQIQSLPANARSYFDFDPPSTLPSTYRVRAYNAAGDSGYSNEASASPLAGGGSVSGPRLGRIRRASQEE